MTRMMDAVRQNLRNMKKSPRVADVNMYEDENGAELPVFIRDIDRNRHGWNGISLIYSIIRAPLTLLSCVSHPRMNGADGAWASGEPAQTAEINHLMVSDGMRYAIMM